MKPITFYFDFISPYSFLASQLLERTPAYQELDIEYRPVVFGTMLARLGAKGPGEIPSRRRIGLQDLILLCQDHGIPLEGPPTHPFNSIYAMRSVCGVEDHALRAKLTALYFRKTWCEGESLEDLDVLRSCLAELGIDQDPDEAASRRECRAELKANTKKALSQDVWGVPTFMVDDILFFGHDRLELLRRFVKGELEARPDQLATLLERPQPGRIT